MRCSDCSRIVKPIVAIDIDGTLADYHSSFIDFSCEYLGARQPGLLYSGRETFSTWWMNAFKATREQWTAAKLAYRQGGFKRWQRPFGGTIGFTYPLMRMGAEVWVTTTRPYLSLDTVMADTKEWLARQHIPYDYMIFDDDKYKTLYDQVDPHRVVAVIDDLSVYLKAAARLFGLDVPIQVATMYNRDDPALGIDRMMLPETSWCMRRRIKKWYDDNA